MAQAAMIEDAIIGLKRAVSRQNPESGLDDATTQPTNRGNKLRANAKYIRERTLGCMNGKEFYRKRTEHAGYKRDILEYNPPRYDSEGDELDFDDSDANADAEAAEDNPYADIFLQDILGPLKRPSELADHPSMRHPYTSTTLTRMVGSVDKRLREEQRALWQAKTLHRQLLGDAAWIPCGVVETDDDDKLFECSAEQLRGYDATATTQFGVSFLNNATNKAEVESPENGIVEATDKQPLADQNHTANNHDDSLEDAEMADAEEKEDKGDNPEGQRSVPRPEKNVDTETLQPTNGSIDTTTEAMDVDDGHGPETSDNAEVVMNGESHDQKEGVSKEVSNSNVKLDVDGGNKDTEVGADNEEVMDGRSPEPPRRMTTRAQANQGTNSQPQGSTNSSTPSLSGTLQSASDADSLPVEPHPLFLLPPTLNFDRNCGVPQQEADETRHLLWAYIQKQESTVRLFAEMLDILRKAYRMKEDVWEWCKADGHLGEMSDGEDWYDREKLGLAEGETLRKGADEDDIEVDEGRASGKRSRRRN